MDLKNIRAQFPALNRRFDGKRLIYFDNACSVLKPRAVISAVNHYNSVLGACAGGRSGHALSAEVEELCHEARFKAASFINAASPSEIIFTRNTTEGINLAARCLPFSGRRDEVLITAFEHHSNMLPFIEEMRKGRIKVKMVRPDRDWRLDPDKICSLITGRTALVSLPLCSNVTGQIFPFREVARRAREKGALVLADAAQYLATGAVDVRRDCIDLLAFSGHKLGGPAGTGVLYCAGGVMKTLKNFNVGGGTVRDVALDARGLPRARYFSDCRRFEAGIQDYPGITGLGAAIDLISSLGAETIARRASAPANRCRLKLAGMEEVSLLGPSAGPRGPIVSFVFRDPRVQAHDFALFLNNELRGHTVCVRCGAHCAIPLHRIFSLKYSIRLSFFVYNTEREADIFTGALEEFLKSSKR